MSSTNSTFTFGRLRADFAKLLSNDETRKRILEAEKGMVLLDVDDEDEREDKASGKEESEDARVRVEIVSNVGGVGMTESCWTARTDGKKEDERMEVSM